MIVISLNYTVATDSAVGVAGWLREAGLASGVQEYLLV